MEKNKNNSKEFLNRMSSLQRLLKSSLKSDSETKDNVHWYCKDQERQCRERFFSGELC